MSNLEKEFYTVRGYAILNQEDNNLTPSMEDYLEMSYRLSVERGFTRITDLANALNVQPPSASKMVSKLADMDYLIFEKYGIIQLTKIGHELGEYLINRHVIIESFLKIIGVKENVLEQTEKIEHFINDATLKRIEVLIKFFKKNPECLQKLNI
ncbi:MAG: transcriptional regulator MntR [Peptococcales bacterium]